MTTDDKLKPQVGDLIEEFWTFVFGGQHPREGVFATKMTAQIPPLDVRDNYVILNGAYFGKRTFNVDRKDWDNKYIFSPIMVGIFSNLTDPLLTSEQDLRNAATTQTAQNKIIQVNLDGDDIKKQVQKATHPENTGLFTFPIADDNFLGLQENTAHAVSAGDWLLLDPLSTNNSHKFEYIAEGTDGYHIEVTFNFK
jgi:hypothetical protein